MNSIGAYITCDDALCRECFLNNTDGTVEDAVRRWEEAGGFEGWETPIFIDGDNEADTPTHCTECSKLIKHELTDHGVQYVADAMEEGFSKGEQSPVVRLWLEQYSGLFSDEDIEIFDGAAAAHVASAYKLMPFDLHHVFAAERAMLREMSIDAQDER